MVLLDYLNYLLYFQFLLPPEEFEKMGRTTDETVQRNILENFARSLHVVNRTLNGGKLVINT